MKHKLKINVSDKPGSESIMTCRNVPVRERLLHLLFGAKHRVTILVPGGSVDEVTIYEPERGGTGDE